MPDYNLKKIKTDLSGNKYLKTDNQETAIIDTFANKNNNEKEDINKDILVENERLVMENKRQKEELSKIKKEIIPRMNDRFQEVENENKELLYENSLLRRRLMQVDYSPVSTEIVNKDELKSSSLVTESTSINDDDHLVSSSQKENDVTSYDPFDLFSELIILFSEIKNILKKLANGAKEYQHNINIYEQESDDLIFYKSIILDSKKFYVTSHKIRKNKLMYDINEILKMFNYSNMPTLNEINKTTKGIIKKYYLKLAKEVRANNETINKPVWIKNNKLKYVETIKREMNRTFLYHIEINKHYRDCLIKELNFFKIK